jgi:hypothetical protein
MRNTLAQMSVKVCWMHEGQCQNAPTTPSNVGAIFLSREESPLLNESRQLSLEKQSQGKKNRT